MSKMCPNKRSINSQVVIQCLRDVVMYTHTYTLRGLRLKNVDSPM